MSPSLRPAILLLLAAAACGSPPLVEGMDRLESARRYLELERYDDAFDLSEELLDPDFEEDDGSKPGLEARGEASYIAAESALALGKHLKAFRRYRDVLENAPWSPHAAAIEERLYEIGLVFFYDDEYGGWFDSRSRGVEVMETLQVHYRRSDLADDALRHVGDYFASEDVLELTEAALVYEQLFREYPDSEWAERSLWLAGHCRLQSVPGPEYNREELLRARKLLRLSLEVHPRGVNAQDAQADLLAVEGLLAAGEVLVADFYAGRGVAAGEHLRLANAALLYPDTEGGRAAAARLQAAGLDLATLAATPSAHSMDAHEPRPAPRSSRE